MPDLGPMRRAFAFALKAVPEAERQTRDVTAVALARSYADAIDQAVAPGGPLAVALALLVAAADKADAAAELDSEKPSDAYAKAMRRVGDAVAAVHVLSDLGPKLLAALTALGMTPAARNANGGKPNDGPVSSTLASLRAARAKRAEGSGQHHPAHMDTTSA